MLKLSYWFQTLQDYTFTSLGTFQKEKHPTQITKILVCTFETYQFLALFNVMLRLSYQFKTRLGDS